MTDYGDSESNSSSTSYSTVRKGSRNDDVRTLQQMLNNAGFNVGVVDGIFGSNTEEQ